MSIVWFHQKNLSKVDAMQARVTISRHLHSRPSSKTRKCVQTGWLLIFMNTAVRARALFISHYCTTVVPSQQSLLGDVSCRCVNLIDFATRCPLAMILCSKTVTVTPRLQDVRRRCPWCALQPVASRACSSSLLLLLQSSAKLLLPAVGLHTVDNRQKVASEALLLLKLSHRHIAVAARARLKQQPLMANWSFGLEAGMRVRNKGQRRAALALLPDTEEENGEEEWTGKGRYSSSTCPSFAVMASRRPRMLERGSASIPPASPLPHLTLTTNKTVTAPLRSEVAWVVMW